jgi:hypothetical protein
MAAAEALLTVLSCCVAAVRARMRFSALAAEVDNPPIAAEASLIPVEVTEIASVVMSKFSYSFY